MTMRLNKERVRLYLYIWFAWMVLWMLHILIDYPDQFFPRIINIIWRDGYYLVVVFVFYESLWPYIKRKRKYLVYNLLVGIFFLWLFLMFLSFGTYSWRAFGINTGIYTSYKEYESTMKGVTDHFQPGLMFALLTGLVRHIYDYRRLIRSAQQLKLEKQDAELNFLKSQTNPHFLFNTLNNIYSLSRDKSDLAPESIMKLSKILRFMLYEADGDYIALEQEMKIIEDYISLEKLRYDESLNISFKYDVEDKKQAIPPLLLIPLVENAFKHGVSETRSRPYVDIFLSCKNRMLEFVVKNSADDSKEGEKINEKIGLGNLTRQLELLYGDFNLDVHQKNAVFTARLKINLASHV